MTSNQKRYPSFSDTDEMPFGKFKGKPLQDVPASYLRWLWGEIAEHSANGDLPAPFDIKRKLSNYIWNSKEAIEMELGRTI